MSTSVFNLSSLDGSNGLRLDGATQADASGVSVSGAGDVNGDGFGDVIVGAINAGPNVDSSGSSYVVFGKATGFDAQMDLSSLNGSNGFRLDGENEIDNSGSSVSSAGDVNGDGFDDVIVGASGADPNGDYSGSSYVVLGKASGFGAHIDLSSLDGKNGFRLDGEHLFDYSGVSVSSAGDINGDGFDDVIVGASRLNDPYDSFYGSSYVVLGKASGFGAHIDLSSLDGKNGFRLDGEHRGDNSGFSVSGAGDINGDGFDDVIVGASSSDSGGSKSGSSYVVLGKASGFGAHIDLSSLDGKNGFRLDGEHAFDYSGFSVSGADDINGDGFDDVIVGAFGSDSDGNASGSSYVVLGKATGFDADMNLSSLDGKNGFRLDGESVDDASGISVSRAGDFNGDGFGDVIVGASGADSNGDYSGSSYVVFGKASGFDAHMDLSSLDGKNGFRLDGGHSFDFSGYSVSSAGDVNGDGFDDLIVGAFGVNSNGYDSGSSYIIFGRSDIDQGGGLPEIKGTEGDDTLKGNEVAEHFIAGAGNDNLLGRGGADVFDAGVGDDAIRIGDLTFASINGGNGNDALHLAGSDMNLDLTAFGDRIHNIETICLYGRGDNTLTLTAETLLSLSGSTDTLKVHGNSGDHIALQDSGWVDGGSQGFYHTYTHDDAVLLVGANVAVEFV